MNKLVATRQIYFRPIEVADIDNGWLSWINDSVVSEYLNYKKKVTRADLVRYLEETISQSNHMFATCLMENDKYVGNARLHSIDWENKCGSYGRLIGRNDLRGRGIGTQMVVLLAYFSFYLLGLNRIETGVIEKNISSIASNEKAGVIREGVQTQCINGKFENVVMFGMTKLDFDRTAWKEIVWRR